MMLYQVVKLIGLWGHGGMLPEEVIMKVSRNKCMVGCGGGVGRGRGHVPPWRLVILEKGGCNRGDV
jgi:hypothetical protein